MLPDQAVAAEVQALDMGGVDPKLAAALKEELLLVLAGHGMARRGSTPPLTENNQVSDLAAANDGSGGADLSWTYSSTGDYDQNGEANISDLTQVGIHFGKNSTSPDWDSAQLADGDENGEVNIADVTPLGLNFGNQVSGYKVFSSIDDADYPSGPDAANGAGASEAGEALLSSATPGAGGRLGFELNVVSHTPGTHYWVRPFDAGSALGATSNMVTLGLAASTWTLTWGTGDEEKLTDVEYHADGAIFAAGVTSPPSGMTDLLLVKFDLNGNLLWAKSWGGALEESDARLSIGSEGEIYVAMTSSNFGAGGTELILQRWNADGDLEWSRSWGGAEDEAARAVVFVSGAAYVAGASRSFTDSDGNVVLVKFDPDGNVIWARSLGGDGYDEPLDMQAHWGFIGQDSIHLTGQTTSYVPAGSGVLYARFSEEGELTKLATWTAGMQQFGACLTVTGQIGEQVFIAGKTESAVILLEYSTAPGSLSKEWSPFAAAKPFDMIRIGDSLVLCGYTYAFSAGPDAFLVNFSPDGAVQGTEIWSDFSDKPTLYGLDYIPGVGLVGCGVGTAAANGSWSIVTNAIDDIAGTWTLRVDNAVPVAGSTGSPSVAPVDVTGGFRDSGGGGGDVLMTVRELP